MGAFKRVSDIISANRFERMCRKIERMEAETDALMELAHPSDPGDARTLPDQEIESQLQALKHECHV